MKKLVLAFFCVGAFLKTINPSVANDPTVDQLKEALKSPAKTIRFGEKECSIEIKNADFFENTSENISSSKLLDTRGATSSTEFTKIVIRNGVVTSHVSSKTTSAVQENFTVKYWLADMNVGNFTTVTINYPPVCASQTGSTGS